MALKNKLNLGKVGKNFVVQELDPNVKGCQQNQVPTNKSSASRNSLRNCWTETTNSEDRFSRNKRISKQTNVPLQFSL